MTDAGRTCPLRYRHGAGAIATAPERQAAVLYVVGGLYGNPAALDALDALLARERGAATVCFNGDFHWFDADDAGFAAIGRRVLAHDALLGNVEAELGAADDAAGCGCAYPEAVDDATVERSNAIHARLKSTAARHPEQLARLAALPMFARYRIDEWVVGVVHGDADSLAGWRFGIDALDDPAERTWREQAFRDAAVDVFASSHTCLPALRLFGPRHRQAVINNGAAGMPNFHHLRCGVVSRIAATPPPGEPLYGTRLAGGLRLDALPLHYDQADWMTRFLANWPAGSAAHASYFDRIRRGPRHQLRHAAPQESRRPTADGINRAAAAPGGRG